MSPNDPVSSEKRPAPSTKRGGGKPAKGIFIAPPSHGMQVRLAPAGKHTQGQCKPGRHAEIRQRALRKAACIAESQRQGNEIAKQRADDRSFKRWFERHEKQIYVDWLAALSPEERALAKANKLDKPMPEGGFIAPGKSEDALDSVDQEMVPHAMHCGTHNGRPIYRTENEAIEEMEPEDSNIEIAQLSNAQISDATEDFEIALRWALQTGNLVDLGRRSIVIIAGMYPKLAGGLEVDPDLAREFLSAYGDFRFSETLERLQETGEIYKRVLEWMRRGTSLSGLGERLQLIAYKLRPDLIDAKTQAKLGEPTNKTRQAVNKPANCLRDTFAGLLALCERGDDTRLRCQQAQLQPA